jgi:dTDP-4-dehydrorhamnose 3,5-epimerase
MITVKETNLRGVLLIQPSVFEDFRGEYVEIYNEKLYRDNGIDMKFLQDDISASSRNVLRGMHGDENTWKLVSCLYGNFYLAVVNYDKSSLDYGKWQGFALSDRNRCQVLIPPKHGNGHVVLSEKAIFHYKQSTLYDGAKGQFTIAWNAPEFNIWWPIKNPILSRRDEFLDKNLIGE